MPVPVNELNAALDELRALYAELDAELAREEIECRRCGRCCNFVENDYVLFASWLERALIEQHEERAPSMNESGACGWQHEGLCGIHAVRPLGCRTAFCDEHWGERQQELYERYRTRLADICRRHGLPWDYRPVLSKLKHQEQD